MRRGFGLITAIIIMITVAVLMSLMIGLSSSNVKQTSNLYIKEQARLYLRSATGFALMAISGHPNNTNCIEDIKLNFNNSSGKPAYHAKIDMWYLGNGIPTTCGHILNNSIVTDDSNYTVVMDITVEADQTILGLDEPIKLHRRTLQKP